MKKIITIISILFLLNSVLMAEIKTITKPISLNQNIKQELQKRFTYIQKIITNKQLEEKSKDKLILSVITPLFDFKLMSKLTLRNHWKKLSKEQQKSFSENYEKKMKNSYMNKINLIANKKIKIKKIITKKKRIIVSTSIIENNNSSDLNITYKLYKRKTDWLIYDISINGISLIKSDKVQFYSFLRRHTIEELIEKINK